MRKWLKKIILILIQLIEKYEYRNLEIDEDDISKKIIDTIDISDEGLMVLYYLMMVIILSHIYTRHNLIIYTHWFLNLVINLSVQTIILYFVKVLFKNL